jgi:uncharacterized ion transporter superfamily protein YfcC
MNRLEFNRWLDFWLTVLAVGFVLGSALIIVFC